MSYSICMKSGRSAVTEVVGRMPFQGRTWVKATYLEGRDAANTGNVPYCLEKAKEIDNLASAHSFKSIIGLGWTAVSISRLAETSDHSSLGLAVVTGLYGLANAAVSRSQHTLANRLRSKVPAEALGAHMASDISSVGVQTDALASAHNLSGVAPIGPYNKEAKPGDEAFTDLATRIYYGAALAAAYLTTKDIFEASFRN